MGELVLDWKEYRETSRRMVSEGMVLLKNEQQVLPYHRGEKIAVFGRIQNHYYKSGTGSGGMVNVTETVDIVTALKEDGTVAIHPDLEHVYESWELEHPFVEGIGWGMEPWSQEEMPVTEELATRIAKESDQALIIVGRTAGEDQDNEAKPGSYLLTKEEKEMMQQVRNAFSKVTVLLNVGNIMDMSFVEEIGVDAVMYVWQGGQIGGYGVADVLTGKVSPSGKLADTIAYHITDYPTYGHFGEKDFNCYTEDIYVGYRYFETMARQKVQYPFGFGLSYTTFQLTTESFTETADVIQLKISVKNTGEYAGKEVVQIYSNPPQGLLGKPLRNLIAFQKTRELKPQEQEELCFEIAKKSLASYDDSGVTGHKSAYVLEQGCYEIYAGSDVRSAKLAGTIEVKETQVVEQLRESMAPEREYERMRPLVTEQGVDQAYEIVPQRTQPVGQRRAEELPENFALTGDCGIRLQDVVERKATMEEFIAQLSEEELSCIIRGEGMGSSRVTPGTAAAFGGVTDALERYGIPCGCCTDGPSGMRLDTGMHAFSLPNGTLIACSFNEALTEELFALTGIEMVKNKIEILLGPGMNIHRHPLNGRNFEYFSEDPYVTGVMATAELRGMKRANVTGSMKHFCGNNQEVSRFDVDSVVSERALREIYLKGYEMAVKSGYGTAVMTTYGGVNGIWTAGNYDLNTEILRGEWGFRGIVMTDWWAKINDPGQEASRGNLAAMTRAQNDLYMVYHDSSSNQGLEQTDNVMSSLEDGTLTLGEIQRCAGNICAFVMQSNAMRRYLGEEQSVQERNQPEESSTQTAGEIPAYHVGPEKLTVPLADVDTAKEQDFAFNLTVERDGDYEIALTAKSHSGDLAQIPVAFFCGGIPAAMYTFQGSNGAWASLENTVFVNNSMNSQVMCRFLFRQSGLTLKEMTIVYKN